MAPTAVQSGDMASDNDIDVKFESWRSSQVNVEELLKLIDHLNDEMQQGFPYIDDDSLQAVLSHLKRVQETLRKEQELRERIPGETIERLKQKELPTRVKLDVGGKGFLTSLLALTSVEGTFFECMFGGEHMYHLSFVHCASYYICT